MTALPTSSRAARTPPIDGGWLRLHAGRPIRVMALLVAIIAISLADLHMTVLFLKNGGMSELNPLARWVISLNCEWLLGAWKVLLVSLCCTILYCTRHARAAELGAWVCAIIMVWLAVRWGDYAEQAGLLGATTHTVAQTNSPHWVQFVD